MAEVALKEQLKERSELINYAREVLQMVSSDSLQSGRESAKIVEKIRSKGSKSKENTTTTIKTLENKISDMKQATVNEYKKVMEGVELESCEPDMHIVKQEIQHCHRQVREMEKDFKKLENEKKILEFHKKHRKLQKKLADVHFDMASNENHVKGYIKRNGEILVFDFDFSKNTPCYVADFLWDNI